MRSLSILTMALVLGAANAWTQSEPDAREILENASAYLQQQEQIALKAEVIYSGQFNTDSEELVTDYTIAKAGNGQASLHLKNSQLEAYFYSDGENVLRYIPEFGQYTEESEPLSAGDLVRAGGFSIFQLTMDIVAEAVDDIPFAASLEGDISYVGAEKVGDRDAHRLHITRSSRAYDIWISADAEPKLLQVSPNMSEIEKQMKEGNGLESVTIAVLAGIHGWTTDVTPEQLTFTPPESAIKVAAFQPPRPKSAAEQLVGFVAPDFELRLIDGGTLQLSAKKDKEIVVLDFWATWCGPCRQAMPIIEKVTGELADQGVRLYAVNLEEDAEDIQTFLKDQNLAVQVALDSDSAVARLYKASAIPQTVIIGKDGIVKVVHVGVSPDFEEELRAELTALAEGE